MSIRSYLPSGGGKPAILGACLALGLSAGAVTAADEPSPSPVASDAVMEMTPFPLPELVWKPEELPTVSIEPESAAGWTVGEAQPYSLGHCGILSPVDVDGSLWQAVTGTNGEGGPIESDEDIGELINATPGQLTLNSIDDAEFESAAGLRVQFERAPGALDYFFCM